MIDNLDHLLKSGNPDLVFEKFMAYFREVYAPHYKPMTSDPVTGAGLLNHLAKNRQTLVLVFDDKNFKILYASDNVSEFSGYAPSEFHQKNIRVFFHTLAWEHILFPFQLIKHGYNVLEAFGREAIMKIYCGMKFNRKDGHPLRLLIRQYPLGLDGDGKSEQSVMTLEDVSHLLKGGEYWCRWDAGGLPAKRAFYHSSDSKLIFQDILSDREKEVLAHIMAGQESREIAERLFISVNTVEKHRKNMLARTGARDTTALVQICKMCNIL